MQPISIASYSSHEHRRVLGVLSPAYKLRLSDLPFDMPFDDDDFDVPFDDLEVPLPLPLPLPTVGATLTEGEKEGDSETVGAKLSEGEKDGASEQKNDCHEKEARDIVLEVIARSAMIRLSNNSISTHRRLRSRFTLALA